MKQKTQRLRDKAAFLLAYRLVDYLDSLLGSNPIVTKNGNVFAIIFNYMETHRVKLLIG